MKKKDLFRIITIVAFFAFLVALTVYSYVAVRQLLECYEFLMNGDIAKGFSGNIYYDDHIYASIGMGLEILPNEPGAKQRLAEFLYTSLLSIDRRILSCGLIYTMFGTSLLLYNLFSDKEESRRKQILKTIGMVFGTYVLFIGMINVLCALFHVPFYFPGFKDLLSIFTGLLCIVAGCCAFGILLRAFRFKKILAIVMVPVALLLFLFSTSFEGQLYSPARIDSFDYVYEIDSRILDENFEGECYYDSDKNVMVVEGKEYPPEQADNPEHFRGLSRIGAFLFEAADPYSGSTLYMAQEISEVDSSPLISLGYLLKATCWIALSKFIKKRLLRNS